MNVLPSLSSARLHPYRWQPGTKQLAITPHKLGISHIRARIRVARHPSAQQDRHSPTSTQKAVSPDTIPATQLQPAGIGAAAKRSAMSVAGYATWALAMTLSLHIWAFGLAQIVWLLVKK